EAEDQEGAAPGEGLDQPLGNLRHDERADADAGDRDARGKPALRHEPALHGADRRHVRKADPDADAEAVAGIDLPQRLGPARDRAPAAPRGALPRGGLLHRQSRGGHRERYGARSRSLRRASVDQPRSQSRVISALRTFETGQFFSAARASSSNLPRSMPGTCPLSVRADLLIWKPWPSFSRVTAASVESSVGLKPAPWSW